MNRIAIVGHAASGYEEVEALLRQCGMRDAQPSRRDGLLPQDISATLCKAHKQPPVEMANSENDIKQIQAGPVWHGMALDLLLGNLDQEFWGWADHKAVCTLDYWKQLDDELTFVLVYDEPHRVLVEAARSNDPQSIQTPQHLLDNWVAYNGALLSFHLRNPGRCMLVHSQQVRRAANQYLQQLQPLLGMPLTLDAVSALDKGVIESNSYSFSSADASLPAVATLPQELVLAVDAAGIESQTAFSLIKVGVAERYLVNAVLENHPAARQTYAELQSVANLPLDKSAHTGSDAADAWETLVRRRAIVSDLIVRLHDTYLRTNDELVQTRAHHAEYVMQLTGMRLRAEVQTEALRVQISQLTTEASERESQATEQAKENEFLLSQLHQVQEELEIQFQRKQALEQHTTDLKREQHRQTEHLTRQIAEAKAALEAEKASAATVLASAQSHVESEKIANAKSVAAQKATTELNKKLKTVSEENKLLLSQLQQVQEELERYYLENLCLKEQLPPAKPAHYGAAMRIKRQLGYRLGAVMIQRSHSLSGWLSMPWALMTEAKSFRQDRAARTAEKLPPIHTYRDVHEAERVKQHLSYRLGSTMLKHGKSPTGWLSLPFALSKEVKQFRLQRQAA